MDVKVTEEIRVRSAATSIRDLCKFVDETVERLENRKPYVSIEIECPSGRTYKMKDSKEFSACASKLDLRRLDKLSIYVSAGSVNLHMNTLYAGDGVRTTVSGESRSEIVDIEDSVRSLFASDPLNWLVHFPWSGLTISAPLVAMLTLATRSTLIERYPDIGPLFGPLTLSIAGLYFVLVTIPPFGRWIERSYPLWLIHRGKNSRGRNLRKDAWKWLVGFVALIVAPIVVSQVIKLI